MRRTLALFVVLYVAIAQAGMAQIPEILSYQGVLTDINGVVVPDGAYSITFSIYDVASGGTALWSEKHIDVQVSKGIFNVILGSDLPLTIAQTPFNRQYWLGIDVEETGELAPRIMLTSSAYSLNARTIVDGAVTAAKLATGAVTTEKILDYTIGTDDLDDDAVTLGKIVPEIVSSVDGVSNDGGNIDFIAGAGISITPDNNANTITFVATGTGEGDITAVYAGYGLTGGAAFGEVTLGIEIPLSVAGSSSSPIVSSSNTGTGVGLYGSNVNPGGVGVYGYSVDGEGMHGASGSNTGVYGESSSWYGVRGYSVSNDGIFGGTSAAGEAGVYGVNNTLGGYGVRGRSTSGYGVYAESTNNFALYAVSTGNHAVHGQSTDGPGVYGSSVNYYGVYGVGTGEYGVFGVSTDSDGIRGESAGHYGVSGSSTAWGGAGVYGSCNSDFGRGVYGYSNGGTGYGVLGTVGAAARAGVGGHSDAMYGVFGSSLSGQGVRGYSETGPAVYADGDFAATGSKSAQVRLDDGSAVRLFCEESSEVLFTDYGAAELRGGSAHIELDPVFLQTVTINDRYPMKVFIQVEGDCAGVYVTNKTTTGFDVVELQGGRSDIPFSYRVVCKRRFYESARLASPEAVGAITSGMMKSVWPETVAEQRSAREIEEQVRTGK